MRLYAGVRFPDRNDIRENGKNKTAKTDACEISEQSLRFVSAAISLREPRNSEPGTALGVRFRRFTKHHTKQQSRKSICRTGHRAKSTERKRLRLKTTLRGKRASSKDIPIIPQSEQKNWREIVKMKLKKAETYRNEIKSYIHRARRNDHE